MIFSDKIYKIVDGKNASLYADSESILKLFIHNKSLKQYDISINSSKNCVFSKEYNYSKIIQLNPNILAIASNGYITTINEQNI